MEFSQARFTEMQEAIDRMDKLLDDVMPQFGKLCIQDYGNLNELCMLITKLKSENDNGIPNTKRD